MPARPLVLPALLFAAGLLQAEPPADGYKPGTKVTSLLRTVTASAGQPLTSQAPATTSD